ncbi:MAG: aspartate/tyrosine/aromatic aminotransferase [Planctomycetales bacterium]|nr:aspartate/tyrosine/aromatic aminotransferase [Planctomycetales bacterium]
MLEKVTPAPPDAILGLTEAFRKDPRADKINLSVGVYLDDHGQVPLLDTVAEAESRLAAQRGSKTYLPIPGSADYGKSVRELLFGADHEAVVSNRTAFAQTPGGTGALRVAADLVHALFPAATVWVSDPTWPNHNGVFGSAGLEVKSYPYFDPQANSLRFDDLLAAIDAMPAGDVILLHGCCHNPTGIDPTPEQWEQIAARVRNRGLLPLLDFAYQGFAEGLHEDAVGLRALATEGAEFLVCSSFSKNFSLYRERVGALCVAGPTADAAEAVQSQVNRVVRSNYSNPPSHGAAVVDCILRDETLRGQWEQEVAQMRGRIASMRSALVDALVQRNVPGDYSFIKRQRGMFSFSGLTPEQVDALREQYGIYIVRSGRINVAGLTSANVERVADAVSEVVGQPV